MSKTKLLIFILITVVVDGCLPSRSPLPTPVEYSVSPIPTPENFTQVLQYMQSDSSEERIQGMWATLTYPNEVETTLPLIMDNLNFMQSPEVRSSAARVLGELGPLSRPAVPKMLKVMQSDSSDDVLLDIAIALGKIGDLSAVPALADNIFRYTNSSNIAAFSAQSISHLTGEVFPDSNSSGFTLNEQGVPLIVLAVQDWWNNKGKYQDWSNK